MPQDQSSFQWRWAHVDAVPGSAHIELLNQLRADDDPAHFPNTMQWIDPQPSERILEVGCGNGAVARSVARFQPKVEHIVAVDASAAMIAAAQEQMAGRDLPVMFQVADAQALPFADASFDRCYAQEVFVILPDPEQALRECTRVLRHGGALCIWEADCDAHALLMDNLELSRRLMRFVGDREYNGAVGRQIIGWLKAWGWQPQYQPSVGISEDSAGIGGTLLREWLDDACRVGIITDAEVAAFTADLQRQAEQGTYFSYTVNFRIHATKPAG